MIVWTHHKTVVHWKSYAFIFALRFFDAPGLGLLHGGWSIKIENPRNKCGFSWKAKGVLFLLKVYLTYVSWASDLWALSWQRLESSPPSGKAHSLVDFLVSPPSERLTQVWVWPCSAESPLRRAARRIHLRIIKWCWVFFFEHFPGNANSPFRSAERRTHLWILDAPSLWVSPGAAGSPFRRAESRTHLWI